MIYFMTIFLCAHCTLCQAERRSSCTSVAESGLVDTVALLAWVAGCLEDEDSHNLATTVRRLHAMNPRGGGGSSMFCVEN